MFAMTLARHELGWMIEELIKAEDKLSDLRRLEIKRGEEMNFTLQSELRNVGRLVYGVRQRLEIEEKRTL